MTTTTEDHDMAKAKGKGGDTERFGVYLTREQVEELRELREAGINPSHLIREAVTEAIARAKRLVKGTTGGKR